MDEAAFSPEITREALPTVIATCIRTVDSGRVARRTVRNRDRQVAMTKKKPRYESRVRSGERRPRLSLPRCPHQREENDQSHQDQADRTNPVLRSHLHGAPYQSRASQHGSRQSPPKSQTQHAAEYPRCVRVHRDHISLRRLKVFSSCGKGPGIGLLSCKCSILHSQTSGLWRTPSGSWLQGGPNEHREHLRLVRTRQRVCR